MKSIYNEAKQHFQNCVPHEGDDDTPPTLPLTDNATTNTTPTRTTTITSINAAAAATTTTTRLTAAALSTSTYDTLQHPFRYDKLRGRWSIAADFYFACTSHAFGTVVFSELPVYALLFGGVYFLPAYLIAIFFYAIPVFVIQAFLGQFSTSGTISAFRVAPIFKGIGYSILLLNLTSLTYYGVIAAVPLIYAANSLHTVIPWMSCDNAWNTPNCSTHTFYDEENEFQYPHATVEFFRSVIRADNVDGTASSSSSSADFILSLPILCGVLCVWLLSLGVLLCKVSIIGKFFRCFCILMLLFFTVTSAHILRNADITWTTLLGYFEPALVSSHSAIWSSVRAAILMATWLLGPGWGSALTLASHNNFRRDSEHLTYWVSFTHVLLALVAMVCGRIALDHFEDHVGLFHYHVEEEHFMQFLYLCFAYLFGSFTSMPNLWSFLFFFMLFIAELSAVIIQMMSVLTAIFDEFEKLRSMKTSITVALVCLLLTASLYFCTKRGIQQLHILPTISILTHVIISFVLLLMTTWIYGRERFQCDLQFMLGKTISNAKILLIRFVTPAFLVISILQILFLLEQEAEPPTALAILSQSLVYLVAPVFMLYKICQTNGTLRHRVKQCFAPHDWHPVDADNRRFYEEVMGTSEMLVIDSSEQA